MSRHDDNKALIEPLRRALRSADPEAVQRAFQDAFAPDARIRLGAPLGTVIGPGALWTQVYAPLLTALPDLERADFIVMAGPRWGEGQTGDWVGIGGNFIGSFQAPWLGIPATGQPVFMRYHEYLRVEDGRIVEMEGLWDIPQLMRQARVWPMGPQRGVEWMCPGPSTGRGVVTAPFDAARAEASAQAVWDMLHDLKKGDAATPDRGLAGYWHPNAPWYGPAGIGSARGHAGIRDVVLKAFREGLSDNIRHLDDGVFFADHDLVAFTGWPSGTATHSGEGFLGLAPTGRRFTRRSLDFWRVEDGMIRENWVMVDMLHLYKQLGVDVLDDLPKMTEGANAA